jgi:hypothetical protein
MTPGEPNSHAKAADALYARIADQASDANPEELGKLAEAYSKITFGPQGGEMSNSTAYNYTSKTDQHETKHDGEERDRPAGFAVTGDET